MKSRTSAARSTPEAGGSAAWRWRIKMNRRTFIFVAILAVALAIGLYLPVDMVRRPIGSSILTMPVHVEVLSCYTLSNGKRIPFDGDSHFGKFWAWRRSLNFYNNIDVGPRDSELENIVSNPHTGYFIFLSDASTNALTYSRAAGWTSGAILGEINSFDKNESGQWRLTDTYRDASDSLGESFYRVIISTVSIVLGIVTTVLVNIMIKHKSNINRKDRQHAPPGGRVEAPRL